MTNSVAPESKYLNGHISLPRGQHWIASDELTSAAKEIRRSYRAMKKADREAQKKCEIYMDAISAALQVNNHIKVNYTYHEVDGAIQTDNGEIVAIYDKFSKLLLIRNVIVNYSVEDVEQAIEFLRRFIPAKSVLKFL